MEKEPKTYQLAVQYNQYDGSLKNQQNGRLPSIIPEIQKEDCHHQHIDSPRKPNIFADRLTEDTRLHKINDLKSYALVGKTEVKNYCNRLTKKKHFTRKS